MVDRAKKQKASSRFTLAPLYLAVALAVCYFVLTRMLPVLGELASERTNSTRQGWGRATLELSAWCRAHENETIGVMVVVGVLGFALPLLHRRLRGVVWLMALLVLLFIIALAAGGYGETLMQLLREAQQVR